VLQERGLENGTDSSLSPLTAPAVKVKLVQSTVGRSYLLSLQTHPTKQPIMSTNSKTNSNYANKRDWIPVGSSNKNNKRKDDMAQDGMSSYQVKTGVIEVRFTRIGENGFNVARSLNEFIASAQERATMNSVLSLSTMKATIPARRQMY
jgi:hypothetical protein